MAKVSGKNKKRIIITFGTVCFVLVLLAFRLAWIQVVKAEEYSEIAIDQQTSDIPLEAKRGSIYDKNGEELASCYFADNDLIAVGAMKALKESGYRIPQDIGIVGFDNLPLGSVVEPALTTIHVPKQYMGEAAAQKLIDLLNTPGQPPTKTEVSTMLVKRGTV